MSWNTPHGLKIEFKIDLLNQNLSSLHISSEERLANVGGRAKLTLRYDLTKLLHRLICGNIY